MALSKTVVLDGHALNPGDLRWSRCGMGELQVFERIVCACPKNLILASFGALTTPASPAPSNPSIVAAPDRARPISGGLWRTAEHGRGADGVRPPTGGEAR